MWNIKSSKLKRILPKATDRALFCGMTGSGKTTLAEIICSQKKYVVVIDVKGLLQNDNCWSDYKCYESLNELTTATEPKLIYKPNLDEIDNLETIDNFFKWIYYRGNTTLYIDEVYGVANKYNIPKYLLACLTRGRQKNICVYMSTQRPKDIPPVVMSEAEHNYIFKLKMPQDRKSIEEITGIPQKHIFDLDKRYFIYSGLDADYSESLTLKIRKGNNQNGTTNDANLS